MCKIIKINIYAVYIQAGLKHISITRRNNIIIPGNHLPEKVIKVGLKV